MPSEGEWLAISTELRRVEVPGGWLYETFRYRSEINDWEAYATTFVPYATLCPGEETEEA